MYISKNILSFELPLSYYFYSILMSSLRDWSLITGRGATNRSGGAHEVLPLQKGGAKKSFSYGEVGAQTVLGSFLRLSLRSFSHIEGGVQKVSTL